MNTEHQNRSASPRTEIHVGWLNDRKTWQVTRDGHTLVPGSFRRRAYAIAFARALATSRAAGMVVQDANGQVTRHAPGTLSYPTELE